MSSHTSLKRKPDGGNYGRFSPTKKSKLTHRFNDSVKSETRHDGMQSNRQGKWKTPGTASHKHFHTDDGIVDDSHNSSSSNEEESEGEDSQEWTDSDRASGSKQYKISKTVMPEISGDESSPDSEDDESEDQAESIEDHEDQAEGDTIEGEDEYAKVKKELSNLPLEDLMKIKERIGLKVFNKIMHGTTGRKSNKTIPHERKEKNFKRENKNRPREMSSKRTVPIARHMDNLSRKHKHRRDPRFDDLSGEYKDEYFEKNYSFLDDVKEKEKQMVKKELQKTTDVEKKKELQGLLMRMTQQKQVKENKKKSKAVETAWKNREKERIKEGKQPYFLKKSERKKLELAEKFKELQKSGKLDTYMSKKRKKNAQKERKKLPQQMNKKT